EGRFIVCDRNIASVVESRDFDALLIVKSVDQAFGSERRGSAVRVMYHDDVLDSEQMLSYRYGTQGVRCPSPGYDNREDRGGRCALPALLVPNNFSRVHFAGHCFRHGTRDVHCARVVTVDNNGPQWDGLFERFSHLRFNESWLFGKYVSLEIHLATTPCRLVV